MYSFQRRNHDKNNSNNNNNTSENRYDFHQAKLDYLGFSISLPRSKWKRNVELSHGNHFTFYALMSMFVHSFQYNNFFLLLIYSFFRFFFLHQRTEEITECVLMLIRMWTPNESRSEREREKGARHLFHLYMSLCTCNRKYADRYLSLTFVLFYFFLYFLSIFTMRSQCTAYKRSILTSFAALNQTKPSNWKVAWSRVFFHPSLPNSDIACEKRYRI